MKAKEFKKYQNYAFYIKLVDLDHEYRSDYLKIVNGKGDVSKDGCGIITRLSKKELNAFWRKEVISIDMESGPVYWPEGGGSKTLILYVSRFTEEERKEKERERNIEKAKRELETLTGKVVEITKKDATKNISKDLNNLEMTSNITYIKKD